MWVSEGTLARPLAWQRKFSYVTRTTDPCPHACHVAVFTPGLQMILKPTAEQQQQQQKDKGKEEAAAGAKGKGKGASEEQDGGAEVDKKRLAAYEKSRLRWVGLRVVARV